jgi:hypothetical protein
MEEAPFFSSWVQLSCSPGSHLLIPRIAITKEGPMWQKKKKKKNSEFGSPKSNQQDHTSSKGSRKNPFSS